MSVHYITDVFKKYFEAPIFTIDAFTAKLDSPPTGIEWEAVFKDVERWTREHYLHRRQQFIDGVVWSIDATFKVAGWTVIKASPSSQQDSFKPISSIFSIFNRSGQLVAQKPTLSNGLEELRSETTLLLTKRYIERGFTLPTLIYGDNCCKDREFLDSILDECELSHCRFGRKLDAESPQTVEPLL
ncbi:hypothetical protein HDU97_009915, partial [Phlyctochytrium planicorne]